MFSDEDRRRAVDLYFTQGMTIRKVVARLGYPSEGALVNWVRSDPRYERAGKRSYTLECKVRAARRALAGESPTAVARDVGCRATSVCQWARLYESEGTLGLMSARNAPTPATPGDGMEACGEDELRARLEALRLENAVLRETIKVLKVDGPRHDPAELTNRERTRVVDALRDEFGLDAVLGSMGLARSTYYYQRAVIKAGDKYAGLRERIRVLFEKGGRVWGYRTIHAMLRRDGADPLAVSEKVVRRIMGEEGLRPVYLRKPKAWSSYKGELSLAPANLVERDFHAERPNELWLTDVTQFTMDGYKCWLSPVIDCFDGMVVAWRLSPSPDAAIKRGHAARRGRHASRRRASHHSLGPRVPLPMGRVDPHLRGQRVDPVHERQGLLAGQRRGRGILRQAQERVLPLPRLEGRDLRAVPRTARRLPDPLQ